ncbi:copper resistance protein CopC [Streptomyces sp. NPDC096132]|uniref:copper resistance CopC family protein n=1 Tax=Streptomyces sp. NPDC096132 TaxID=3366075 RepID=UPI003829CAA5
MRGLRLLRAAGTLGCAGALLLCGGAPAHAHTALKDATPAPGARVVAGTDVVALTFSDLKSGVAPEIGLVGPDGTALAVGQPIVTGGGTACAAVTPLPTGVITLSYRITAADGDTQSSAFQFEAVDGAGSAEPPSECAGLGLPTPGAADRSDTVAGLDPTTATAVLVAAVVGVASGGVLAFRRRRRARRTREGRELAPDLTPGT